MFIVPASLANPPPSGALPRLGLRPSLAIGFLARFTMAFEELGSSDVSILSGSTEGVPARVPTAIADALRFGPDVLVAPTTPVALGAKAGTSTLPIVFAMVDDPVGAGLVASLGRPGGNLTGTTTFAAGVGAKRLQLLKEVLPRLTRVTLIADAAGKPNAERDAGRLGARWGST